MRKLAILLIICLITLALANTALADSDPPVIEIHSPANLASNYYGLVNFSYTPRDQGEILWCRLRANDSIMRIDSSVTNDTLNHMNDVSLTNGTWNWRIECMDNVTRQGNSSNRSLVVAIDGTPPTVLVDTTSTTTNLSGYTVFNYTPFDNETGVNNCSLIVDDVLTKTDSEIENNTVNYFSDVQFKTGTYIWYINCSDYRGNTGSSPLLALNVEAYSIPIITLNSPANNTMSRNGYFTFKYTPVCDDTIRWCKLLINGTTNQSDSDIENNTVNEFKRTYFRNGTWTWQVNCTTINGVTGYSELRFIHSNLLTVYTGYVQVTLEEPMNATIDTTGTVTFKYTVDSTYDITSCELLTNDSLRKKLYSIVTGTTNEFPNIEMSDGIWDWRVKCVDGANNSHTSSPRTLIVEIAEPTPEPQDLPQIEEGIPSELPEEALPPVGEGPGGTIMVTAMILVIIGGAFMLLFTQEKVYNAFTSLFRRKTKHEEIETERKMNELKTYVTTHFEKGYTEQEIERHLLAYNWKKEEIEEAIAEAKRALKK